VPLVWLALFLATPLWLLAGLAMLIGFPSWHGKATALWTLLPLLGFWLALSRPRWAALVAGVAACSLLGFLAFYPFPKKDRAVSASTPFPTLLDYLCNFVPERDLSALGVGMAYSGVDYDRLVGLLSPLYNEMAADPMYDRLPHVVGSTATDLFTGRPGKAHYFSYTPPDRKAPQGKRPALFFYHGALGNFTVYLHFWRRWAERRGWIVVCPSNGFGRWYDAKGEKRALDLFDQALQELPIDPSRVMVVGMSNGATAATRLTNQRTASVGGLLLVCPVLEVGQTLTPTFLEWTQQHPPPIVLEGTDDINVSPAVVGPNVKAILENGGRCDYLLLDGHDHHILFSAEAEVTKAADLIAEELEKSTGQLRSSSAEGKKAKQ
jgi:dienelactone hydrolase